MRQFSAEAIEAMVVWEISRRERKGEVVSEEDRARWRALIDAAPREKKLAPWWKLGCEEVDDSVLYYHNDTKLEDMPFGTRLMNCLEHAKVGWRGWGRQHEEPMACGTVGEMRQLSEAELLCLGNFGKKTLKEFKDFIWMRKEKSDGA